jgi:hypothetical protein
VNEEQSNLYELKVIWSVNTGSTLPATLGNQLTNQLTESEKDWIGVAVTLLSCIREVFYSNLSRDIDYPKFYHGFPLSLEENAGIMPLLGYDHFLSNHHHHLLSIHPMLYNAATECVVK